MIKNFKKFLRKDINLYYKNSKFKSQNFQIPAAAIFKKIAAAFSITIAIISTLLSFQAKPARRLGGQAFKITIKSKTKQRSKPLF